MMFEPETEWALKFVNQQLCRAYPSGTAFSVEEKQASGRMCLQVTAAAPCIHVRDMDQNKTNLIRLRKCADHVILVYDETCRQWDIHIVELKRTISKTKWEEGIQDQFHGGVQNAFALCGILHIGADSVRNIYTHCAYMRNSTEESFVGKKLPLGQSVRDMNWMKKTAVMEYLPQRSIINGFIPVNRETGQADVSLPG